MFQKIKIELFYILNSHFPKIFKHKSLKRNSNKIFNKKEVIIILWWLTKWGKNFQIQGTKVTVAIFIKLSATVPAAVVYEYTILIILNIFEGENKQTNKIEQKQ